VLDNGPEAATTFLSVAAGATAAPLNPAYRADEYEFYLSDLRAKLLIVAQGKDSPSVDVADEARRARRAARCAVPSMARERSRSSFRQREAHRSAQRDFAEPTTSRSCCTRRDDLAAQDRAARHTQRVRVGRERRADARASRPTIATCRSCRSSTSTA
jgi:acyl-coenzyme A synthetase/AMP-(fatty) acid ligase